MKKEAKSIFSPINTPKTVAVIGYGNDLRSDDAVGQWVARAVQAWGVPNVCSFAVHQLTPELAETLVTVALAIFVDAYRGKAQNLQVCLIKPARSGVRTGHTSDPRMLLAIAQALYGYHPEAWWLMVPAVNFEVGDCLSSTAERGITEALEQINDLIRRESQQIPHEYLAGVNYPVLPRARTGLSAQKSTPMK